LAFRAQVQGGGDVAQLTSLRTQHHFTTAYPKVKVRSVHTTSQRGRIGRGGLGRCLIKYRTWGLLHYYYYGCTSPYHAWYSVEQPFAALRRGGGWWRHFLRITTHSFVPDTTLLAERIPLV
jgi:hypothetical protein